MKKYNSLLKRIASEWNIQKGNSEKVDSWKARIIYSVAGRMGYAAMSDFIGDPESTSIIHVKRRISNVISHYEEAYPEIENTFEIDTEGSGNVENEIYNIFLNTGQMYHMPDRVVPAMPRSSVCGGLSFTRGLPLSEKVKVCGVGTYNPAGNEDTAPLDIRDMFQLQKETLKELWERVVSQAVWSEMSDDHKRFFLNTRGPFSRGYWLDRLDCKTVSMCGTGMRGNYLYYLCKKESNKLYGSQLPTWLTNGPNYRSLACGCLQSLGTLPPTIYQKDGEIVTLKFGYLPSPAELNFIKLYSWPLSYKELPQDFNRIMTSIVFFAIKPVLESIGYQFTEE